MNRETRETGFPPRGSWRPLRGPFARWPRVADAVLATVVFLSVFLSEDANGDVSILSFRTIPIAVYVAFAVASGALIWRRSRPLTVLGVNLAIRLAVWAVGFPEGPAALLFALYSAGRYSSYDRWSSYGVAAALALIGIHDFLEREPPGETGFALLVLFLVWYSGRRIRSRGDYLRLLQERAAHLEREQAAEAQRAVLEERTRIARELHDVVAHRVSVMTVQSGAAKTVAAVDPQAAVQAMEAVENAGRQALNELRHLLGVLRPGAETNGLSPQPVLADVPRLVEQFRDAGVDVELRLDREHTTLPAHVELSAYRIVQEALTNVLKHAGPHTRAEAKLTVDDDALTVEVLDNGGGATTFPESGHGLAGMRERALLLGGSLDAGPRPGGGFRVVGRLPLGEEQR